MVRGEFHVVFLIYKKSLSLSYSTLQLVTIFPSKNKKKAFRVISKCYIVLLIGLQNVPHTLFGSQLMVIGILVRK